jgi:hypothetical protein
MCDSAGGWTADGSPSGRKGGSAEDEEARTPGLAEEMPGMRPRVACCAQGVQMRTQIRDAVIEPAKEAFPKPLGSGFGKDSQPMGFIHGPRNAKEFNGKEPQYVSKATTRIR